MPRPRSAPRGFSVDPSTCPTRARRTAAAGRHDSASAPGPLADAVLHQRPPRASQSNHGVAALGRAFGPLAGGTPAFPGGRRPTRSRRGRRPRDPNAWIPACAGMTKAGGSPAFPGPSRAARRVRAAGRLGSAARLTALRAGRPRPTAADRRAKERRDCAGWPLYLNLHRPRGPPATAERSEMTPAHLPRKPPAEAAPPAAPAPGEQDGAGLSHSIAGRRA